jgi:hypothetical protein
MAWTDPDSSPTGTFTAARWNTYIRDNLFAVHHQFVPYARNTTGGTVAIGTVVALLTTADADFTTTTTVGDARLIGVTQESIANNAFGYVLLGGVTYLQVTGTVVRGNLLQTSATAGRAQVGSTNPFAVALEANPSGTATIAAFVLAGASALGSGGGGSSYYQMLEASGVNQTQRGQLNLVPGAGILLNFTDDAGNDRTTVEVEATGSSYYQTIEDGGTPLAQQPTVNFIEGTDITLTIADNPGSNQTDITIASTAGGGDPDYATTAWFTD